MVGRPESTVLIQSAKLPRCYCLQDRGQTPQSWVDEVRGRRLLIFHAGPNRSKPLRAKGVTHLSAMIRGPCLENGPEPSGAHGRTRTSTVRIRNPAHYPVVLRALCVSSRDKPAI